MKLKRFLLFAGDTYYPSGGWDDYKATYATRRATVKAVNRWSTKGGWAHAVDSETGEIIQPRKRRRY